MNADIEQPTTELERALGEMTAWHAVEPNLWESALKRSQQSRARIAERLAGMLHWSLPRALAASIVIVTASAVVLTILLNTGQGRHLAEMSSAPNRVTSSTASPRALVQRESSPRVGVAAQTSDAFMDRSMMWTDGSALEARLHSATVMQNHYPQRDGQEGVGAGGAAADVPSDRMVVKKATIELETADVRSAFLKAAHLVSEASGEYVEASSLTGEHEAAQGNLTLRVAADRLDRVMNELRDLAHVRAENLAGDDVTAQVVDLDARLRNEQRVETELLQLLEKRTDAPLADILQLREEISRVRQHIEQIAAQQQRLSRLVSLATVLVIIRPAAPESTTQPQQRKATMGAYFGESIASSWSGGMRFLADTLAGLVGVLVGGAVWWIALIAALLTLIAALLTLRQHLRRRAGLV